MNFEHYENEGFLYINKHSTETFVKGEIRDSNNILICPGVIVPIINPIHEANREDFYSDKELTSIESYLPHITYVYSLQKGKKIRIYWDQKNKMFMVSSEHKIYYDDEIQKNFYLESVNFDLLDKNMCYYAIVNSAEQKLVLTNIVKKEQPELLSSYDIYEDLAFAYHIDHENAKHSVDTSTVINIIDEQLEHFENGVLFILNDGQQIEYRNTKYNYYCMLQKPETMSIYIYFILALNRYAEGATFEDYFVSLCEYIHEYLEYFPEYMEQFLYISMYLKNYAIAETADIHASDQEKIKSIQKLLQLEPEELLLLLVTEY